MAFGGTKSKRQVFSARTEVSIYPFRRFQVTISVGQGKQGLFSIRVTRQTVIDEPPSAVVSIDCPVGPVQ